jgi:hypothetical protein
MAKPLALSGYQNTDNWFQSLQRKFNELASFRAYVLQSPATGFSYPIPDQIGNLIITPAGGLATGTVILPANVGDGFKVIIVSTQAVASLTLSANSGQSLSGATTALTANVAVEYIYSAETLTWYKLR